MEQQTVWVLLAEVSTFGTVETRVLGVFTSERRAEQERETYANQNAYLFTTETRLNTES